MKRILIILLFLPLALFAKICGKVVGVADGDTFTLLTKENKQIKIRLHGIDCPEKKQDYGQVAKQFTSDAIYGKEVCVDETDIDRYGRTIGIVHYEGKILNEELLKAGLAWHYKKYDSSPKLAAMEETAHKQKKGLWSMASAIAPWEFRHQVKQY